jgi:hypothetical protein
MFTIKIIWKLLLNDYKILEKHVDILIRAIKMLINEVSQKV